MQPICISYMKKLTRYTLKISSPHHNSLFRKIRICDAIKCLEKFFKLFVILCRYSFLKWMPWTYKKYDKFWINLISHLKFMKSDLTINILNKYCRQIIIYYHCQVYTFIVYIFSNFSWYCTISMDFESRYI